MHTLDIFYTASGWRARRRLNEMKCKIKYASEENGRIRLTVLCQFLYPHDISASPLSLCDGARCQRLDSIGDLGNCRLVRLKPKLVHFEVMIEGYLGACDGLRTSSLGERLPGRR